MKIVVVSDTHGDFASLRTVIESEPGADMLIHLGDGERDFERARELFPMLPAVYVAGNCDYAPHEQTHVVTVGKLRIFCCHGHRYGVRQGAELLSGTAHGYGCVLALYGHTHVRKTETLNGVTVMNPGSPSCPRGGNAPSYGVIYVNEDGFDIDIKDVPRTGGVSGE